MQDLDERKRKILKAIIQTYLETGEPVGSRTISKYTDLNLSSATIRNEMSDLEDLGYIVQPHTSAGRIPSDLGYRLYVDELMKEKDQEVSEMKEMMIEKTDRMERVLKQVVKVLASNTNYATLITGPTYHHNKVKFIQLSKLNEEQLLAVIVVEGNLVKNQIVNLDETIDDEQILKLNLLLNTQLNGLTIEEIRRGIESLETIRGRFKMIETDKFLVVDDCYNANPVSMMASIDVLSQAKGRKIAVLGDMGELGSEEKKLHGMVGTHFAGKKIDALFVTGTLAGEIAEEARRVAPETRVYAEPDKEALEEALLEYRRPGDTILVKASHFMGFSEIVKKLEQPQ